MFQGFTKKKLESLTLGEQLRKIRGSGRITLCEVSRETKIPVKYLEMIESGEYGKLPPDVYVKGFLKKYAEYLGIDFQKIVHLYQRDKDIEENLGKGNGAEETLKLPKVPHYVITPKAITAFLMIIVGLGGFFYLFREIGRFASLPRLVITEPKEDVVISGNSITISGFTDQDARLSINDQPVLVGDSGEFHENILVQSGVNTIVVSAINRFGKTVSQTLNIKSNFEKPEIAFGENKKNEGQVSGEQTEKEKRIEIFIRIDSLPTWLSVKSDGSIVYSGTMLPGATQTIRGEREIRITSGKANQTFIKVNGGEEKVLDVSPGIVRDVLFTPND